MKKRLRRLLEQQNTEEIADLAGRQRRVLSTLISLTFDRDPLIGWRAVEAVGRAAERIAQDDPDCVRDHLRRLHWLLNEESGGVCWRAPEAMAEIVRREPSLFADYIPIVVSLILNLAREDIEHFRTGILWAIGRLGAAAGDHVRDVLPAIALALDDADPQVRGVAVWCLGQVGQARLLAGRPDLLSDEGTVDLYEDGVLDRTSVCHLVRRALRDGAE
jgi:hypothetical protein